MDPLNINEEDLQSLLQSAGPVSPSTDFTGRLMARIEADASRQPLAARHWPTVPRRTVGGVLVLVFLANAFLLLRAGDNTASDVVFSEGVLHPFMQLLTSPVTLMALSTLAIAVWVLVLLERTFTKATANLF